MELIHEKVGGSRDPSPFELNKLLLWKDKCKLSVYLVYSSALYTQEECVILLLLSGVSIRKDHFYVLCYMQQ